jgi:phosphoserine phosphatase RsbU/P
MATLTIISGAGTGRRFPLFSKETLIGRSSGLPISLEGTNISRHHAKVVQEGDHFFLEDLGSSNGTFINDRRVTDRVALCPNDTIQIGGHRLRFEMAQPATPDVKIQQQTVATASNTSLYLKNAAQKLQAVLELAHQLASTLEPESLLERFLDQVVNLFPKADRVLVIALEAGEPFIRARRDIRPLPPQEQLFSRSVLKQVKENGDAVLAQDPGAFEASSSLNAMGIRSLVCVPLRAPGGSVFGAVQLDRFKFGDSFTTEDLNLLTAVTLQISLVLEQARLHHQLIAQERLARDFALAREIQAGFLPQKVPVLKCGQRLDLFAELHPANEVSGDFYDFIVLDDSRVALLVADVSGKGMPAAIFMSMVRAMLRQSTKPERSAAEILARLNDALARDNPKLMFVTILLGIYNAVSGECVIARAGHPPPILKKANGTAVELPSSTGCLLGYLESCPPIDEYPVQLEPGDALLFYTDGVTEAEIQGGGEMFGPERLRKTVEALAPDASLSQWSASLRGAVNEFSGGAGFQDDLTLLLLRRS